MRGWREARLGPGVERVRVATSRARPDIVGQFLRFGTVGALGFVIDTASVYALRGALGLYGAGLVAYVIAASANWALNRRWTFRGWGGGAAHRQWARFLLANLVGFVLNRGTYAALVGTVPLCATQPVIAVAAGAVAGMGVNFTLCRQVVFTDARERRS
ncbi:MAG: GtrA family protein [Acetobacteraceae bacterium]|nr:GtrA family protein [Acetobacteraceae bacterium]